MQLPNRINLNYKLTQIALLSAFATLMFILESLIPMPMPWLRIGLANLFSLLALKWWGLKEGFLIALIRILIGHLLIGRFLSPAFLLSICSGMGAVVVMFFAIRKLKRYLSLIGVSILGACIHNWIQLLLIQLFLMKQMTTLYFFPILTLTGIVTGIFTGGLAILIDQKYKPEI